MKRIRRTAVRETKIVSAGPTRPTPNRSSTVIVLEDVTKTYAMGDVIVRALQGVTLDVDRGEYLAIMGASGSGKSTLMNIIGCLDAPTKGKYYLDGLDVAMLDDRQVAMARNKKIGFVFQSFNLIARTSALENVELPMAYAGVPARERKQRAMAALERVGLADRVSHIPTELSGGQQQRTAIARALTTNPAMLLADEPTGALDTQSTKEILDLFDELHHQGRTIVLITHEADVAARANRTIRLSDGKIISDQRSRLRVVS